MRPWLLRSVCLRLTGRDALRVGIGLRDHVVFKLELSFDKLEFTFGIFAPNDFLDFGLVQIQVGPEVIVIRDGLWTTFRFGGTWRT